MGSGTKKLGAIIQIAQEGWLKGEEGSVVAGLVVAGVIVADVIVAGLVVAIIGAHGMASWVCAFPRGLASLVSVVFQDLFYLLAPIGIRISNYRFL